MLAMKKIFLTFIYSFSLCFLIGQDSNQEVWSTWYLKPIYGKAKQLEKGLIDHVKKHHGQGEWPEYYFEILSGPNEGSFAAWSGPHTWKAFDERVRSQADLNHWNQYVAPFADMSDNDGTSFLVLHEDLRFGPAALTEYYHLSWNMTYPGTGGQYREIAETIKKVKEATNSKNYHTIYQVVSGSNPDAWLWEYPINSMEELSMSTGGSGSSDLEKALGVEGAKNFWNLYRDTIKSRVREIQKFRLDMSTPADTSQTDGT